MSKPAGDMDRTVEVENLVPGMKLAHPVKDSSSGDILLESGAELDEQAIHSLRDRRIMSVKVTSESYREARSNSNGSYGDFDFSQQELEQIADDVLDDHKDQQRETIQKLKRYHQDSLKEIQTHFEEVHRRSNLDIEAVRGLVEKWIRFLHDQPEESIKMTRVRSDENYLFSHSLNVTILSMYLAMKLGMSRREIRELGTGTLLHDVGMLEVPDEILTKEGSLSDDEYQLIQQHPSAKLEELQQISGIGYLARLVIAQHHERIDGSGYPEGLSGEEISRVARIVAVTDSYDAMISPRQYRDRITSYQAMQTILRESGKKYWKTAANQFFQSMALYPIGTVVELDNGAVGMVQKTTKSPMRPELKVIADQDGNRLDQAEPLSLLEHQDIFVSRVLEEVQV